MANLLNALTGQILGQYETDAGLEMTISNKIKVRPFRTYDSTYYI